VRETAADSGKLFGSVTAGDVVAAIKRPASEPVQAHRPATQGRTSRPWGTTRCPVHLHPEIDVEVSLDVVAES